MKRSKSEWTVFILSLSLMLMLGFLLGGIYHRSLSERTPSLAVPPTAPTFPTTQATQPTTEPTAEPTTESTTEPSETLPELPVASFDADALRPALERVLDECDGKWAVYAESLQDGESIFCGRDAQANDPMISASMIKMFIMAKTYEMAELGLIDIEDVYRDMFDMITISDNDDTNRLTRYIGGGDAAAGRALVSDFAARMGCPEVKHNRLMLDFNGYENYVSVGACAKLLRMIYEGSCVSEEASAAMLEILLAQTDRNYIPAGVPNGIDIALKGGDLPNCQGDAAVVFLEGNPYIVCIITNSAHSDFNERKIGELSGLIYEAMAQNLS